MAPLLEHKRSTGTPGLGVVVNPAPETYASVAPVQQRRFPVSTAADGVDFKRT
jgi:hypothetical protein